MKKLLVVSLCLIFLSPGLLIRAETIPVRFKATIKAADNSIIPLAYIKIYQPGVVKAVDSMFCDGQGKLDAELPFAYETATSIFQPVYETGYIIKKIHPNVIGQNHGMLSLDYQYPSEAKIFFLDIQGRIYRNHSDLLPGMYFYFIRFDDGNQSELNKIVITESLQVNVILSNLGQNKSGNQGSKKSGMEDDMFIAEIIKDGYMTIIDTLVIDSAMVTRAFRMDEAPVPTAAFSHTGSLVAGEPVVFNATASMGAEGEELAYHWSFGDGMNGGSPVLPHLYNVAGDYDVTLTVRGNYGSIQSLTRTLTIEPAAIANVHTGVVNGFITDENQDIVEYAKVSLVEGDIWTNGNAGGIVLLSGLPVGVPIHLKITKDGYVDQLVELIIPEETGESVFFSTLKTRDPGFVLKNAEFGGGLEGSDGTKLNLPVLPFVKPDGSEVTGDVEVNITPVDVAFETSSFPGSFVGYDETGEDGVLLSYGVSEFHFEQDGEALQLAEGKKAIIYIPIYTGGAEIGKEIPLWSVNEDNGKWVKEGMGTVVMSENSLTGLALRAEVNHFSWFNCDDFEDDRKKKGLCYIWDCTSAICYKMKVGCWVSGARRESTGGKKAEMETERDTIPPVFEVRDFLPPEGRDLLMPTSRDVYIEARGFSEQGQLMGGKFNMLISYTPDTFGIELTPIIASDTVDLELNTVHEDYLQPAAHMPFRFNIPEKKDYHIIFNRGEEGSLSAAYTIRDKNGELATSQINQNNFIFTLYPGEIILSIYGYAGSDEGSFVLAISEPGVFLPGDTTAIEIDSLYEEYLNPGEFHHFTLNSNNKPMRIQVGSGSSPSLRGRFLVNADNRDLLTQTINNQAFYFVPKEGPVYISVAGQVLTDEGNFTLLVDTAETMPLALNDSINDSLRVSYVSRLYSLQSDHNTLVKIRINKTSGESGYRTINLRNASGKILATDYLYEEEEMIYPYLLKDSIYLLDFGGYNLCHYTIITREEEINTLNYGDTIKTRLKFNKDKDLYRFAGQIGEMISVVGIQENYELNEGSFVLITPGGEELGRREIRRVGIAYDNEIIYKLPDDGEYFILIESMADDTGSYELTLDTISYTPLPLNAVTEVGTTAGTVNYFEFVVPEEKICHLSVISPDGGGFMDIFSGDGERVNEKNSHRYYTHYYNSTYTNLFPAGNYFMRLTNDISGIAYVNLVEPRFLDLNEKGEKSFQDTIHEARKVNAFYLRGNINDGVQGVLKAIDELPSPSKLELRYFSCRSDGAAINMKNRSLSYYSLDSTFLYDSGGKLEGERDDSTFVLIVYGETEGIYEFNFHQVASSVEIRVDDDYSEYPDAHTSSPVAAGYAVKEGGSIFIANGEYASCISIYIDINAVRLQGQDKENTWLQNVYDISSNPVIWMNSDDGRISDVSLSCGRTGYDALEFYGSGVTLQNMVVKPLPGKNKVSGTVKVIGDNAYIEGIFLDRTLWGLSVGSSGGIVENCEFNTDNQAIRLTGGNTIIRDNIITIKSGNRAISAESGATGPGNQIVENNQITIDNESGSGGVGVINIERYGGPDSDNTSYVRNNTINTNAPSLALSASNGNPPALIILEGNKFYCTHSWGGKALNLSANRSDGGSSIIARNNIFDGLHSDYAIGTYNSDLVSEGYHFGIYNNSFRMAATADQDTTHIFISIGVGGYEAKDTIPVYLINNIFHGDGYSYFAKCQKDFAFYADYNIVDNFRGYIRGVGSIIGMANDIDEDPLYLDTDLHIAPTSPAIDRGASPIQFEFIPEIDINGILRPQGSGYDIGAYEKEE